MFWITLQIYTTGGMLMTIGDVYGVSKSSVSKAVANATHHIGLSKNHFIKFLQSNEEINNVRKEFSWIAKFSKVIAAIGCTHINISSMQWQCWKL